MNKFYVLMHQRYIHDEHEIEVHCSDGCEIIVASSLQLLYDLI